MSMTATEVTVKLIRKGTTTVKKIREVNLRIEELLRKLNINPVSVVVFKNGVIVTEDDIVEAGDVIEVHSASPGG